MAEYSITDESTVTFHNLFRGEEEDGMVMVGRRDIGSYVTVPVEALEVIDLLDSGKPVGEVIKFTQEKYGEDIGVAEFVQEMIVNEMVKTIDKVEIPTTSQPQKDMLSFITQKHVSWLYSKYAWVVYGLLALVCAAIFVLNPHYIPHYQDFFFHPWYSVAVIFWFFFGWLLIAYHEMSHLFAARAVGTEGYFSLSNRLVFIVAQTNLGNIWTIPRKKRYIVYMAGMAWDTVLLFVMLMLLLLTDYNMIGLPPLGYAFVKSMVFAGVWALIWQFRFNMQTDIYYVVANFFKCTNLLPDAQGNIKNFLSRFIKRIKKTDFSNTQESEMRAVNWYTLLYFVGTSVTIATFFLRSLPLFIVQIQRAVDGITTGFTANSELFTDGAVLICVASFNWSLWGYLVLRTRWNTLKQGFKSVFSRG
ncbi:MAG: hypothetical protein HXS54_13525 [Theionarchaea archaeon]|nr:hypothetical protein [Theionarchaea archaeon]